MPPWALPPAVVKLPPTKRRLLRSTIALTSAVGAGGAEPAHDGAVAEVEQGHVALGRAVDGGERPTEVDGACGRTGDDLVDGPVQGRVEPADQLAGADVEGEDVVARRGRTAHRRDAAERAADDEGVADLDHVVDLAVVDRGRLARDRRDDAVVVDGRAPTARARRPSPGPAWSPPSTRSGRGRSSATGPASKEQRTWRIPPGWCSGAGTGRRAALHLDTPDKSGCAESETGSPKCRLSPQRRTTSCEGVRQKRAEKHSRDLGPRSRGRSTSRPSAARSGCRRTSTARRRRRPSARRSPAGHRRWR